MITISSIELTTGEMGTLEWMFDIYIDGELFKKHTLPKEQFLSDNTADIQKIELYLNKHEACFREALETRKDKDFIKQNKLPSINAEMLKIIKTFRTYSSSTRPQ